MRYEPWGQCCPSVTTKMQQLPAQRVKRGYFLWLQGFVLSCPSSFLVNREHFRSCKPATGDSRGLFMYICFTAPVQIRSSQRGLRSLGGCHSYGNHANSSSRPNSSASGVFGVVPRHAAQHGIETAGAYMIAVEIQCDEKQGRLKWTFHDSPGSCRVCPLA